MSLSRETALIACTASREIGVDIEWIRSEFEIEDLAQHFFSIEENKMLKAVPQDHRASCILELLDVQRSLRESKREGAVP